MSTARAPHRRENRLLDDHRLAALYGLILVAALAFMLLGVGRHPTELAPQTTIRAIGEVDESVYDAIVPRRSDPLTAVFRLFDLTGRGIVTIPLRIALFAILVIRRRYAAATAFALAWASSEIAIEVLKQTFGRGRPWLPLVQTVGYSFPSGHATAAAAIGVSIVFAFLTPGHRRRVWIGFALAIAFAMAFSRVYLGAHWLSDVVTGVLLGSVCAIGGFAVVDEVLHRMAPRTTPEHPTAPDEVADEPADP